MSTHQPFDSPVEFRRNPLRRRATALLSLLLFFASSAWIEAAPAAEPAVAQQPAIAEKPGGEWVPLFDGKTLDGWKVTKFGGQGEVEVRNGRLILAMGNYMTGVTTTRQLPRINYEVKLQAMRVAGTDFFCGLTFRVMDDPCTLIIGGWGGGVCGLSSLNGMDASENGTTTYRRFENNRWYDVRLRVTRTRIQAWLDGERIVDQDITGRKIGIRPEVELSRPFGFSSWDTTAALRNIRLRTLKPGEAPEPETEND